MHNAQCTMHNAQCIMHNAECGMQNAQCTMQNAQCTMQNAQCRMRKGAVRPALAALLSALLLAGCASVPSGPPPERIRVATWNLENLFDTVDDPENPGDDEYSDPAGWRRWTPERYRTKLEHLATVIAALRPDILFVAEVENRRVLDDLAAMLREQPEPWPLPHIAHRESPDHRGIDVAVLSRYPLRGVALHETVPFLRGVLEAHARLGGGADATLFACHLKSQLGDAEENIALRHRETLVLRALAEGAVAADPGGALFIAGDFNDNFDSASLRLGLGAATSRADIPAPESGDAARLYNLVGDIPEAERGSYYYARRKVWNTFDAIVVPAPMVEDGGAASWRLAPGSAVGVFRHPLATDTDGRPRPFRRVRRKDGTDEYMEGCSDHFPLWADFVRRR